MQRQGGMILTDEEPRLGLWPDLCLGLNGQAEEVLETCTRECLSFLPRSSSVTVPTAEASGADCWGVLPFCSSLEDNRVPPLCSHAPSAGPQMGQTVTAAGSYVVVPVLKTPTAPRRFLGRGRHRRCWLLPCPECT